MQIRVWRRSVAAFAVIGLAVACMQVVPYAQAARERKVAADGEEAPGALEARRLFGRAYELMEAKETDRAVRIFESILEQYPATPTVYPAALELGRHYLDTREHSKALPLLKRLRAMEQPDKELAGDEKEWFLEALYLTGVSYFQMRNFGEAFPVLRKITANYSGTVWANQAYYYIGMCHFAQRNWSKAIEALGMVGAFVDPDSPTADYMEAGRRFYVRVEDRDLPMLARLGKAPRVTVKTTSGDSEEANSVPLTVDGTVIGSLPTAIGIPKPGDGTLQVLSEDVILSTYNDETDESGALDVARTSTVKVVSSGALAFKLGDYESTAASAYLDQPCCLLLLDGDLDVSNEADPAQVTVIARYKQESDSEDVLGQAPEEEVLYVTRDRVRVPLRELGTNTPVRTGRFGGKFEVVARRGAVKPSQDDAVLTCDQGDELIATYTDTLSIQGPGSRVVSISLPVLGELDSRPRISQDVVFNAVIRSKKNLVESTAYLELARIFRSMGLLKGAKEKVSLGLERSQAVIQTPEEIPDDLRQQAYKLTWELHMAGDDFPSAIATCGAFNRIYPNSPLVDEALMGMGRIRLENREYDLAVAMFRQVLALELSESKGEAQFSIGDAIEKKGEKMAEENLKSASATKTGGGNPLRAQAIQEYKVCAERYPESSFAPLAIEKVVDYYVEAQDYVQAGVLLDQVFTDYPDAPFLDSMYLKWTLVAYQSGDYAKAQEKCARLISDYPESAYAAKAKQILPRIQSKLASRTSAEGS